MARKKDGIGCVGFAVIIVAVIFIAAMIEVNINPPKPRADSSPSFTSPASSPPPSPASAVPPASISTTDDSQAIPLTQDQKANIAAYKAAAAELMKSREVANVDYEKGRMWINVVSWDNDTKGYKEAVLQGLYVASFGNAKYKKATVYSANGSEELGHYVGVEGPTIVR